MEYVIVFNDERVVPSNLSYVLKKVVYEEKTYEQVPVVFFNDVFVFSRQLVKIPQEDIITAQARNGLKMK